MRQRMPRGQRKQNCKCGEPVRPGQRTCRKCHAAYMRQYRFQKFQEKLKDNCTFIVQNGREA